MFWRRRNDELDEEIASHIAHEADRLEAEGMPRGEAEAAARRAFGPRLRAREETRRAWRTGALEAALHDALYGLRLWRRDAGMAAVLTGTLALGLGAGATLAAFLYGLIARPLPFSHPAELVEIYQSDPRLPAGYKVGASPAEAADWAAARGVAGLALWNWTRFHLPAAGGHAPESLYGLEVTGGFFELLGAPPALGRTLTAEDARLGRPVAVLSDQLWRARFGADPAVIGRTVRLGERSVEIIGVMPPRFHYPPYAAEIPGMTPEIWLPMTPAAPAADRGLRDSMVLARLRTNVTAAAAEAELNGIVTALGRRYPESTAGLRAHLEPLDAKVRGKAGEAAGLLAAAIVIVLGLALANGWNLMLARAVARRREMAIRTALGATRARLLAQSFAENLILALFAAGLALAAAAAAARVLVPLFPRGSSRMEEVAVDGPLAATAAAVAVLLAALLSLAPAWRSSTAPVRWEDAVPRHARWQRAGLSLVTAQVALSVAALAAAAVVGRSVVNLLHVDLGFRPEQVLVIRLAPPPGRLATPERLRTYYDAMAARVAALPGVRAAGLAMSMPFSGRSMRVPVTAPSGAKVEAEANAVTAAYFHAMGTRVEAGTLPADADAAGEPLIVINHDLAARLGAEGRPGGMLRAGGRFRRIAAITASERHWSAREPAEPQYFLPVSQADPATGFYLARILTFLVISTDGPPGALAAPARQAIWDVDPDLPLGEVRTMTAITGDAMASEQLALALLAGAAGVTVLVAAAGIYGALAYAVNGRRREIGIRLALGATRRRVFSEVMRHALATAAAGAVAGLAAAAVMSRGMGTLLFGVQAADPLAYAAAAAAMGVVAAVAGAVPAARAARVEPQAALRRE